MTLDPKDLLVENVFTHGCVACPQGRIQGVRFLHTGITGRARTEACVLDFERNSRYDNRLSVSYLKVMPRFQGNGIATHALEWLRDNLPEDIDYVAFTAITSQGIGRLIERVFGPMHRLNFYAAEQDEPLLSMEHVPAESPQANLRYARGPSGYVRRDAIPMPNLGPSPGR